MGERLVHEGRDGGRRGMSQRTEDSICAREVSICVGRIEGAMRGMMIILIVL